MQKFEYRTPRFMIDLPILLQVGNRTIAGRCKEISKEGMKVQLDQTLPVESCAAVSLTYKDLSLELRCSVAHTGPEYDGLKFLFESERDRIAVERLIALISGASGPLGPVLVR